MDAAKVAVNTRKKSRQNMKLSLLQTRGYNRGNSCGNGRGKFVERVVVNARKIWRAGEKNLLRVCRHGKLAANNNSCCSECKINASFFSHFDTLFTVFWT
jgi:hypothetical protein